MTIKMEAVINNILLKPVTMFIKFPETGYQTKKITEVAIELITMDGLTIASFMLKYIDIPDI